ncbi:hypothetical protein Bbelb_347470 [Branchiostoma belcheri]|nr:hypothetical protein Bbelb_347470 [Branchiostoma belcheri]
MWRSKQISIPLKMKLFQSIVVPTAIYACESWRSTKETVQMLDTFQRRCLRTILGISWRDHVSNEELMQRAKVPSLSATVMKRRLSFAGHVWRLPDLRTTKTALTWKPEGTRPRGRPRVTLRKTLQNDGVKLGLNSLKDMAVVAQDRNLWRQKVRQGVDLCNKVAGGSKIRYIYKLGDFFAMQSDNNILRTLTCCQSFPLFDHTQGLPNTPDDYRPHPTITDHTRLDPNTTVKRCDVTHLRGTSQKPLIQNKKHHAMVTNGL